MRLGQASGQGSVMISSERCRCICCRCLTPLRSLVSEQHPPLTNPPSAQPALGRHRLARPPASQVGVGQAWPVSVSIPTCPSPHVNSVWVGLSVNPVEKKGLSRNSPET